MADNLDILKQLALQIRNASENGENTAERVGRAFVGILNLLSKLSVEELRKIFLSRDQPDETNFIVKFLNGIFSSYIQSLNFSSGPLGTGFVIKVDPDTGKSYIEVDELFVRIKAMFTELEIKKLSYTGGNYIFSTAGMKCAKVEEYDTFWRCYLIVDDGATAVENPFRENDQVRFQEFNIKPDVYEDVSNRYYWRLCVGTGDDYIDLSKVDCDANSDIPQEGDSLVQLGNRTDKSRQNAIELSVYGDDAPSIHQYAGIDSYTMAGKEVTVISPKGNKFMGDFILKTGVNILTQFQVLENLIYSEISSVRDEVQAKDNYLFNAAFASNMSGWETTNNIRFFTVNGRFLYFNDNFYSRKDNMAAIVRYDNRNVLRIINSGIKQLNTDLAQHPAEVEGENTYRFFISFRYMVVKVGTLTIGFPGQGLYYTERLEANREYLFKEYSGLWNGTGDFELKFSGEMYLHSLALTYNSFDEIYTHFESRFEQTDRQIDLLVKATSIEGGAIGSKIEIQAQSISSLISETDKFGRTLMSMGIVIDGENTNISAFVEKNGIINAINISDEAVVINANRINLEAYTPKNGVIAAINLGEEGVKIKADKIDISGAVTFNALNSSLQNLINEKASSSSLGGLAYKDAVESNQLGSTIIVGGYLNTDYIKVRRIDAEGAKIGGFTIENGSLYWKGYDYMGGDSRSVRVGVPIDNNSGMVDINFNAATQGKFGIKIIGSNSGGACIYASRYYAEDSRTYPNPYNTYAGYFDGGVFITESLLCRTFLANGYGTGWTMNNNGDYSYQKGISGSFSMDYKGGIGTRSYTVTVVNGIITQIK